MDLHILCAIFISFRVLEALLIRMHALVFFKMVVAAPVQSSSGDFLNNFHACVLRPNNAPENDADTIQIYIQISKHKTTLNYWENY